MVWDPSAGALTSAWAGLSLTTIDATVMAAETTAHFNELQPYFGAWSSWTPALTAVTTNPTLGTASSTVGRYIKVGKTIIGWGRITFGTSGTNAGSGTYKLSLPVAAHATQQILNRLGPGFARLTSAGLYTEARLSWSATANQLNATYPSSAVNGSFTGAGNATPGAWTANDFIDYDFMYEAA